MSAPLDCYTLHDIRGTLVLRIRHTEPYTMFGMPIMPRTSLPTVIEEGTVRVSPGSAFRLTSPQLLSLEGAYRFLLGSDPTQYSHTSLTVFPRTGPFAFSAGIWRESAHYPERPEDQPGLLLLEFSSLGNRRITATSYRLDVDRTQLVGRWTDEEERNLQSDVSCIQAICPGYFALHKLAAVDDGVDEGQPIDTVESGRWLFRGRTLDAIFHFVPSGSSTWKESRAVYRYHGLQTCSSEDLVAEVSEVFGRIVVER